MPLTSREGAEMIPCWTLCLSQRNHHWITNHRLEPWFVICIPKNVNTQHLHVWKPGWVWDISTAHFRCGWRNVFTSHRLHLQKKPDWLGYWGFGNHSWYMSFTILDFNKEKDALYLKKIGEYGPRNLQQVLQVYLWSRSRVYVQILKTHSASSLMQSVISFPHAKGTIGSSR